MECVVFSLLRMGEQRINNVPQVAIMVNCGVQLHLTMKLIRNGDFARLRLVSHIVGVVLN